MLVTAVCIRSIGTDLVAVTAFDTLVRKMGYSGCLVSLSREELWILGLNLDCREANEVTNALVDKTGIFVNPNTHTRDIVGPDEMLPHSSRRGREELGMAVWSRQDPQIEPVKIAVRERMGVRGLEELRRLVIWWPHFAVGARRASEIAESMVPTRSRKEGLLANPHYQSWCVIEKEQRPQDLLRTVGETEETI